MVLKIGERYFISRDREELEKILKKVKQVTRVFDGHIEDHGDFFTLRFWETTNAWISDKHLRNGKEKAEDILKEIRGVQPLEIKSGRINDIPDLGEPDIVIARDPDGEYGTEVYIRDFIYVLGYYCDIMTGRGSWSLSKYTQEV